MSYCSTDLVHVHVLFCRVIYREHHSDETNEGQYLSIGPNILRRTYFPSQLNEFTYILQQYSRKMHEIRSCRWPHQNKHYISTIILHNCCFFPLVWSLAVCGNLIFLQRCTSFVSHRRCNSINIIGGTAFYLQCLQFRHGQKHTHTHTKVSAFRSCRCVPLKFNFAGKNNIESGEWHQRDSSGAVMVLAVHCSAGHRLKLWTATFCVPFNF